MNCSSWGSQIFFLPLLELWAELGFFRRTMRLIWHRAASGALSRNHSLDRPSMHGETLVILGGGLRGDTEDLDACLSTESTEQAPRTISGHKKCEQPIVKIVTMVEKNNKNNNFNRSNPSLPLFSPFLPSHLLLSFPWPKEVCSVGVDYSHVLAPAGSCQVHPPHSSLWLHHTEVDRLWE